MRPSNHKEPLVPAVCWCLNSRSGGSMFCQRMLGQNVFEGFSMVFPFYWTYQVSGFMMIKKQQGRFQGSAKSMSRTRCSRWKSSHVTSKAPMLHLIWSRHTAMPDGCQDRVHYTYRWSKQIREISSSCVSVDRELFPVLIQKMSCFTLQLTSVFQKVLLIFLEHALKSKKAWLSPWPWFLDIFWKFKEHDIPRVSNSGRWLVNITPAAQT